MSTRALLKQALAGCLYYGGGLKFMGMLKRWSASGGDAAILTYHRVLKDPSSDSEFTQPGLIVSTRTFHRQMSHLAENYRPVSLMRLVTWLGDGTPVPRRTVVVTFDDGWHDNFTQAFPILREYKIPATIFLSTDFIDRDDSPWFHRLARLLSGGITVNERLRNSLSAVRSKEDNCSLLALWESESGQESNDQVSRLIEFLKRFPAETIDEVVNALESSAEADERPMSKRPWMLRWTDVEEMASEGVEFGSHGCSHHIMTGMTNAEAARELAASKRVIEEKGRAVGLFAYPNGDCDDSIVELVSQSGYAGAVVTTTGPSKPASPNIYALRRIGVHEGMSISANGAFSPSLFSFGISGWQNLLRGNL